MLRRILTLIVAALLTFLSPTEEAPKVVPLLSGGDSNFINVVTEGDITAGDDVIVGDDLTVGGDSTLSGDLGVGGELTVDQDAYLNAGATIAGNPLTVTTAISNAGSYVGAEDLDVHGTGTFTDTLTAIGELQALSNITNSGAYVGVGDVDVHGAATITGAVDVKSTLNADGAGTFDDNVTVDASGNNVNPMLTAAQASTGNAAGAQLSLTAEGNNTSLTVYGDSHTTLSETVRLGSSASGTDLAFFTESTDRVRIDQDGLVEVILGGTVPTWDHTPTSGAFEGSVEIDGALHADSTLTVTAGAVFSDNLTFVGSGLGLQHGYAYGNEITWTQASAAQNTWYDISDSDMTSGPLNGIGHSGGGTLTVTVAGMYLADWTGTFEADGANVHVQVTFSIDGSEGAFGQNHIQTVAINREETASGTAILDLTAGQTVNVSVRTTDSGTPDLFIDHLHIRVVQIGGT